MKSLLARLLLVVIVACTPALVFHIYTATESREVRQKLVEAEALSLVRTVNGEQQRIIEGAEQVLDVLGVTQTLQDGHLDHCQRLLTNLLVQAPRYTNAVVIGLDGRITCAALPGGIGIDLSDRPYFKNALRTRGVVIGAYTIGRTSGQPSIQIAKQFHNSSGLIGGVVEVSLSLDWLGQQLDRVALPKDVGVRIADRNGIVLAASPHRGNFVGKAIPVENKFTLEGNDAAVRMARDLDGRMRMVAFMPLGVEPLGLFVAVGLDPDITLAGIAQADRTGVLLIIAGCVLALALTVMLGNHLIRRPVVQLLHAAALWRTGALGTRTGLHNDGGEFGQLGAAFDDMAASLENREHAVRTALESTTDAVMVVDRNGNLTYLNRQARALAGNADLVGRPLLGGVFSHLETPEIIASFHAAMATALPTMVEVRSNRTQRIFQIHGFPSEEGLTLYVRDVTEERRVVNALRESETRLELARDAMKIGVWERDVVSGLSVWSDQIWRLHGFEPRPGLADFETWASTLHPEDRAQVIAKRMMSSIEPGQPYHLEHRVVWPNGEVHWLLTQGAAIRDKTTLVLRLIGITMDVTASRETEAALRTSEARLQLAREAAGFGVWDRDIVRDTMFWSEEQWRLLGLEPCAEAPDADAWLSCVHPDDRERVITTRTQALNDPAKEFDCEFRVVWTNGVIRWLQARSATTRNACGEPIRIVGVTIDVTENRESEAALRRLSRDLAQRVREEVAAREAAQVRATQAERVQALGQLAGGIAHDFNNILQAVSGAITMIARRAGDETAIRRLVRLADDAIDRGASITRRLLTFGRRGDLLIEAMDVPVLLRGLQEMLTHTLGASIEINIGLGADLPPVLADKRQLEAVLVNLATNARDAMTGGGRLILSADAETVSSAGPPHPAGIDPGDYVRLTVSDTGAGMDDETLARAREPFFTTKKLGAGTGLGLAMAQNFAANSRGALSLESLQGEGTTVTLWLPKAEHVASARPPADPITVRGPGPAKRQWVLVVDDEAVIREVLAEYLEAGGYNVLSAANGAEALTLLASEQVVDALITDLSMPGMDGLAVIRSARERYPVLPAILLTGYAGDDDALALGRSIGGAVSLLRKPIGDVRLLDRLGAMLAVETTDKRQIVSVAAVD